MMEKSRKAGKRLEGCLGDIKKELKSMKRKDVEWSRERERMLLGRIEISFEKKLERQIKEV